MEKFIDSQLYKEIKLYFQAKMIGSFLLFQEKLIGIDDEINDIDFMVPHSKIEAISFYLKKHGYNEIEHNIIHNPRFNMYLDFERKYKKEKTFNLHLFFYQSIKNKEKSFQVKDCMMNKFERGRRTDYLHLSKAFKTLYENYVIIFD